MDRTLTEELTRVEQSFWTATRDSDARALERLVAPEFTLRSAAMRDRSLPRQIWMGNTISGLKDARFQLLYVAARKLTDDLAVASQQNESGGVINGRDASCICYGVDFWKKRQGAWQIVGRYAVGARAPAADRGRPDGPPGVSEQLTTADVDPQLTDTLRELEQQLASAALRRFSDSTIVDRLVDSEFTLRTSAAPERSVSRASWIEIARMQNIVSIEEHYHAARRLAEDVGVVSLMLTLKAADDHPESGGRFFVVDVWKNQKSNWRLIARYSGEMLEIRPR
jgi:hypothetical protein